LPCIEPAVDAQAVSFKKMVTVVWPTVKDWNFVHIPMGLIQGFTAAGEVDLGVEHWASL
jgi:hypothetical protein